MSPYLQEQRRALQNWYHLGLNAFEDLPDRACGLRIPVPRQAFDLLADNVTDPQLLGLVQSHPGEHDTLKIAGAGSGSAAGDPLRWWPWSPGAGRRAAEEDDRTALVSFALQLFDDIGIQQDDRGENAWC